MPEVPVSYSLNGLQLEDPQALLRLANQRNLPTNLWLGKANRFILPKGKNPGIGWVLMKQSVLNDLDLDKTNFFLEFEQGGSGKQLIKLVDLVVIQADAIYGAGIITDETLYLVELADKRHLFFMSAVNRDYNVLSPDGSNFFDDSLNSGAEWTWQEVLDDLFALLPDIKKTIAGETTPQLFIDTKRDFLLTTNPENLRFRGISAWEAINHVLDRLNYSAIITFDGELIYDPEWEDASDSFVFGAKGILDKAIKDSKALDVSLSQTGTVPRLPETVRVFFPSREPSSVSGVNFLLEKSAKTVDTVSTTIIKDVKTAKGTVQVIWDELEAVFDENGAITNQTDLNTRALEVATAFLESDPSEQPDSRLYIGLLAVLPGTFAAFVSWGDIGSGLVTETGQVIPDVIKDRKTEILTPMINDESALCGDLLAGWTPNQVNDSDEPKDAGTATVTLTSDDVPTFFTTNTVNRVPGFVNKFAWHLNQSPTSTFASTLWTTEDFLDITKDFTVRYVFQGTDFNYATDKYLWDYRGGIVHRIHTDGGNERFQVLHFDGTTTQTFEFSGLNVLEDRWYSVHQRWDASAQTLHLQVTELPSETVDAVQTFAAAADPDPTGGTRFHLGDLDAATAVGFRGFMDGHLIWAKFLLDCDIISDFKDGFLRTLPVTNPRFNGSGKIHYRDHIGFVETIDDTTTTIMTIPVPTNTSISLTVHITYFRTDDSKRGGFYIHVVGDNRAGTVTIIGDNEISKIEDGGGAITFSVSGTDILVEVTGDSSSTKRWHAEAFEMLGM